MNTQISTVLATVRAFGENLLLYHYVFFTLIFLIFIVMLILSFMVKKTWLSVTLILFSFMFVIISPIITYFSVNYYVYNVTLSHLQLHKFIYIDDFVVTGTVKNTSQQSLKECNFKSVMISQPLDERLTQVMTLIPNASFEQKIVSPLAKGEELSFRLNLPHARKYDNQRVFISVDCR